PALSFTNHWIGIYEKGATLAPSRRAVKTLNAAPALAKDFIAPSDPSTLASVYEKALSLREAEHGPSNLRVARAAADLGKFLMQARNPAGAEAPLRKAARIDQLNGDSNLDSDRESLAAALEAAGKTDEALALFQEAAGGRDAKVAVLSWTSLARLDRA